VVYDEYGPVRMVRTRDWKYVHRYPDGPHELFDLRADPDERRNRYADPAAAAVLASLRSRLTAWFDRYADPACDGAAKGVTGCGQIGRAQRASGLAVFADDHTDHTDWDLWLPKKHA
jgi:choline-sulfatase